MRNTAASTTLTIRLPEDLARWLSEKSKVTGIPKGQIVREHLEEIRSRAEPPYMKWAGVVDGPPDLSTRKGYSRG